MKIKSGFWGKILDSIKLTVFLITGLLGDTDLYDGHKPQRWAYTGGNTLKYTGSQNSVFRAFWWGSVPRKVIGKVQFSQEMMISDVPRVRTSWTVPLIPPQTWLHHLAAFQRILMSESCSDLRCWLNWQGWTPGHRPCIKASPGYSNGARFQESWPEENVHFFFICYMLLIRLVSCLLYLLWGPHVHTSEDHSYVLWVITQTKPLKTTSGPMKELHLKLADHQN